jgi:hypothetical protein
MTAIILDINPHEEHLASIASFATLAVVRGGITVKPHVQAFADALEAAVPEANSFGTYVGHSPPEGPTQSLDVFTADNAAGYAVQDRVCAFIKANQKRFGIRYCIRRHEIWNIERDDEGWRDQGVTGNRTEDHYDHVHVTFYATAPGPFGSTTDVPTPTIKEIQSMEITYVALEEDWVLSASLKYFGKLPFGDTLDGLKKGGALKDLGDQNPAFHKGIVALAGAVGFTGIQ